MEYIATNADKISVVNCSLGSSTAANPYVAIRTAVQSVVNQGVVFVAAAGNNTADVAGTDGLWGVNPATGICDDFLPAAVPEAMAVSAVDVHIDQTAVFSNYSYLPRDTNFVTSPGGAVDVAAPGVDSGDASSGILSTWIGETYKAMYGTSAAAPHVAGLVALYIAANGRAYDAQGVYNIRQAIVNNSLPQSEWNNPNPNPMKNGVVPLPTPLAMPSENWVPQPRIVNATLVTNSLQMSFQTVPGYTYAVQYSASLTATNTWTPLTSTNGSGSLTSVTVADPAPSSTSRFYRLVRQPAP
jgi:subtilisin family serine protease